MKTGLIMLDDLHDNLKEPLYEAPITTTSEVNRLNCLNKNLVSLVIQGKTIVNLLCNAGDCETINLWSTWQTTLELDSSNKVFGSSGMKFTATTTAGNAFKPFIWDTSKYYCISAFIKNGTIDAGAVICKDSNGGGTWKASSAVLDKTKFNRVWFKLQPSDIKTGDNLLIGYAGATTAGQYGYIDGIMLEEISVEDYNNPNFVPSPYISSDTSVGDVATRIKTRGKNLLNLIQGASSVTGTWLQYYSQLTHSNGAIVVKPNTIYSVSLSSALKYYYIELDINRNVITQSSSWSSATTNFTYTTGANAKYLVLAFTLDNSTTIYPENYQIMLNEGTTATTYEPYEETYAPIQYPLRSLPSGVKDSIEGNKYIKRVEKVILDGSLNYNFVNLGTVSGYKAICIPSGFTNAAINQAVLLKYNNKKISIIKSAWNEGEVFEINYNNLGYINMTIPNSDSGWGDSYTPTADEIKAYFNGWRMYDASGSPTAGYNRTDKTLKAWVSLAKYIKGDYSEYTTTCPTSLATRFIPYRLYYQLATPLITEINMPNLVAFPNSDLIMESDGQSWVRPTVTYTLCKNSRANLESLMQEVARINTYKLLNGVYATTQNITYYVDADKGDDVNNNGLSPDKPFKTIQKAINSLPQVINHVVNIYVTSGVYNESVKIYGFAGGGYLNIIGSNIVDTTRQIIGLDIIGCKLRIAVKGLYLNSTNAFYVANSSYVTFDFCSAVGNVYTTYGFIFENCSRGIVSNCQSSSRLAGVLCEYNSEIIVHDNSGYGSQGMIASYGGTIVKTSTTHFTGQTNEYTATGGVIR